MSPISLLVPLGLAGLFGLSAIPSGRAANPPLKVLTVGQEVPDLTLPDTAGRPYHLKDLRGRVVVVDFYSKECPTHQEYNPRVRRLVADFGGDRPDRAVFLGLAASQSEPAAAIRAAADKARLTFPILMDYQAYVATLLGAETTPQVFVIDRAGILRFSGAIDDDEFGEKITHHYARDAIAAVLAGHNPPLAVAQPNGCPIENADLGHVAPRYGSGQRVDDFRLMGIDGRERWLSDFDPHVRTARMDLKPSAAGRGVLLAWVSAHTTTPGLARSLDRLARQLGPGGKPLAILAIVSDPADSPAALRRLARDRGWTFPVLKDYQGVIAARFAVTSTPTAAVIGPDGTLVARKTIEPGSGP